jgi:L-fucose mutarotase
MLTGINPLLTGRMLQGLDEMGHSETVAIVDANFPAHRFPAPCIEVPGIDVVTMTRAVREVLPLDPDLPPVLMDSGAHDVPEVQRLLVSAADGGAPALVERWAFYDLVDRARLVLATGELRLWGNVLLSKGIPTSR